MSQQVAVWMDGEEARVFHVGARGVDESTIHSPTHHVHRHPKDQLTRTHNHPDDEHRFFRSVAETLKDGDQILILGPSMTKLLFLRYLQESDRCWGRTSSVSKRRTTRPIDRLPRMCASTSRRRPRVLRNAPVRNRPADLAAGMPDGRYGSFGLAETRDGVDTSAGGCAASRFEGFCGLGPRIITTLPRT